MQEKSPDKQLIIRFPLPYRIGENTHPGNADEKVRCEAGTYAWIEENCADITIPKLYGLRLSTGQTVCSHLMHREFQMGVTYEG